MASVDFPCFGAPAVSSLDHSSRPEQSPEATRAPRHGSAQPPWIPQQPPHGFDPRPEPPRRHRRARSDRLVHRQRAVPAVPAAEPRGYKGHCLQSFASRRRLSRDLPPAGAARVGTRSAAVCRPPQAARLSPPRQNREPRAGAESVLFRAGGVPAGLVRRKEGGDSTSRGAGTGPASPSRLGPRSFASPRAGAESLRLLQRGGAREQR